MGQGKTVVLVGTRKNIRGIIAMRDEIRPDAKDVIEKLHRMGIKVVMLSGDNSIYCKRDCKRIKYR